MLASIISIAKTTVASARHMITSDCCLPNIATYNMLQLLLPFHSADAYYRISRFPTNCGSLKPVPIFNAHALVYNFFSTLHFKNIQPWRTLQVLSFAISIIDGSQVVANIGAFKVDIGMHSKTILRNLLQKPHKNSIHHHPAGRNVVIFYQDKESVLLRTNNSLMPPTTAAPLETRNTTNMTVPGTRVPGPHLKYNGQKMQPVMMTAMYIYQCPLLLSLMSCVQNSYNNDPYE